MRCFTLLGLTALALSSALQAQDTVEPGDNQEVQNMLPFQKAFTNLPEKDRKQFIKHQRDAIRLFNESRIFETLEATTKARVIFPDAPELLNLRGSCYVQLRAFDKALVSFNEALKLTPDNLGLLFNVAEMHFVTQEWEKAHKAFSDLLEKMPEGRPHLRRISEFKLMLIKLKLGRLDEAKALANKYDYLDDSPYHYYAKAALSFEEDDALEAQKWMARAARIFRKPAILAPWHDTMIEYGYIGNLRDDTDSADQ